MRDKKRIARKHAYSDYPFIHHGLIMYSHIISQNQSYVKYLR